MVLFTAAGLQDLNIHCGDQFHGSVHCSWSTWSEHTLRWSVSWFWSLQLVYMIWTYTAVISFMVLVTAAGLHDLNIHCGDQFHGSVHCSWSTWSEHTLRWSVSWFCSLQLVYMIWTYTAVINFMVLFTAAGLHDLNIHCGDQFHGSVHCSWSTWSEHTLRWSVSWFCSLQLVYMIWTYTAVISFMVLVTAAGLHDLNIHCGDQFHGSGHCSWSTWSEHTLRWSVSWFWSLQLVYMIWTYTAVISFMVLVTAAGLHDLNIHCGDQFHGSGHCSWSTWSEHTLRWSVSWFWSLQLVYMIWTYTAVISFMVLVTAAGLHDLNIHCGDQFHGSGHCSWSTWSEHTLRWSVSWFCSLQLVYMIWTYTAVISFTKYFPFLMGMGGRGGGWLQKIVEAVCHYEWHKSVPSHPFLGPNSGGEKKIQ